jgi:hypothetical protein
MPTTAIFSRFASLMLGKSVARAIVAERGRVSLNKYRRYRKRLRALNREFARRSALLDDISRACRRSLVEVREPIALVSQIQRSGGSLLSQLFDGHPELHAHPHELKIGFPKKHIWPVLDMHDSPQHWFELLFEDDIITHFRQGYEKGQRDGKTFAFILPPALQRRLFVERLEGRGSCGLREIFDAYMTSYFGAWINNANAAGEKKFVTAFTPRLADRHESIRAFFEIYPDGRLISIVRDPRNWYPSAHGHETAKNKYQDIRNALLQWKESARSMLRNKAEFGQRVCLLRFEDLIAETEAVMRHLCGFLQIDFDPLLLIPTFNKNPIRANTSFRHEDARIMTGTLQRYQSLDGEARELIAAMTAGDYRAVCAQTVRFQSGA